MHFYECIIKVEVGGNRTIPKSAIRYWEMMINTKLSFKEHLKHVCQNATNTLQHLHKWAVCVARIETRYCEIRSAKKE